MSELEPRLELGADAWEVMASSSAPVFVFSLADHRILAVNGAFTRMYGYTAEEATALRIEDLIPEGERHVAGGGTAGGGGDLTDPGDWHHRTKDGSLIPVVISASDMVWRGTPCRVAAVTDISRLKQVETRLRREKSLSDLASRLAKVGGWSLDPATGEGEWSDELYRIHGIEPPQPGTTTDWGVFIAEDRARVEEFNAGVARDRTPRDMEIEMTMAGGDVKCLRVTARPVVEHGSVVRIEGATQDVTDLKQAMERAREDEVVLASLFQVIPDLYFEFDEDTVIRDYHAHDKSALYVSPEVFLGKPVGEVLPPDAAAAFRAAIEESGRTGSLVTFEYDLAIGGSARHFECRVSRLAGGGRSVAIVRDMTEQHAAQQALVDSEHRFRQLLESAPFPILIVRVRDDVLLYANERAEARFDVDRRGSIGEPLDDYCVAPQDRDRLAAELEAHGYVYDAEVLLLDAGKQPYWALISASVVDFEGEPAVMTAINDISDRKEALLALERERAQLRTLIRAIPDLVWAKDLEGRYIACNEAFERLYGITEEGLLGKTLEQVAAPEAAAVRRAGDEEVLQRGKTHSALMPLVFASDGVERLVEVIRAPVHDGSGAIVGLVGIGRDVTESRRNERRLGKRVKEQHCLYEVYRLTEDEDPDLDEVVPQIVATLKQSWQYPDITEARVCWAGKDYATSGFCETPWMQSAVARTKRGEELSVTVTYAEEAPAEAEGPFLAEERMLIDAVATRLVDTADWAAAYNERLEHEQLLATMFAQSTDAIVIVDPETGEFVDFNLEAHAALGYSRDEFTRLRLSDFQAEHDEAAIGAIVDKAMAGAMVDLQTRHRHKDGRILDAAVTIRGVTIKGRPLLSAVWRDVTDQKAREQELLETAERLRLHNELLGLLSASQAAANGEFAAFAAEATELISRSVGEPFVSVWLFDDDESRLECVDAYDRAAGTHVRVLVIETAEFPAEIAAHKAARYVDAADALSDQRTAGFAAGLLRSDAITALLDCAVVSAGRVRGVFSIGHVGGAYEWPGDRIAFACQVADQLGMALLNRDRLATARELDEYRLHLEDLVAARTEELEAARAEAAAERRQDAR